MYAFARPLLFRLDPEKAHDLALWSLHHFGGFLPNHCDRTPESIDVMGLRFPNRIGLAAGLDKNGIAIDAFSSFGFGHIEVGTVTPRPQPGNPKPRMFRLPEARAIINRMGFNNDGVDNLIANVRAAKFRGILGINIGKNFDTPIERAADDYLKGLEAVYPHASYVTVNISSPNTKNLRQLQGASELDALLGALKRKQRTLADQHGRYVPVALKIAPDIDAEQLGEIADALRRHQIDAVIATNTTLARDTVKGLAHAEETGGLSGGPLTHRATQVVRDLATALAGELPIIAVGGVLTGEDARAKLDAGAALVQIYSGFIYAGPPLVREAIEATRKHTS
ncbi:quinone-dependent dihydroorotate dehydrogenase [Niveibacterium sp. SC-1]|uniref:quinone-dependent dihydroorotate dehydrogenase n=1 Tax=Niveibacterium sp. SC-1 TaxID=3135646 RepID=UPI00311D577D